MVAVILDASTHIEYFSGFHWNNSERSVLATHSFSEEITFIGPTLEKDRLKSQKNRFKSLYAGVAD
jgi:hypothetical protein